MDIRPLRVDEETDKVGIEPGWHPWRRCGDLKQWPLRHSSLQRQDKKEFGKGVQNAGVHPGLWRQADERAPPTRMKVTVGGALVELEATAAVEVRVVGSEPKIPPWKILLCRAGTPVTSSCILNHCKVSNWSGSTSQMRPVESRRNTASCATASIGHSVAIASSTVSFSQPGVRTTVQIVPPIFLVSTATAREPKGPPGGVSVIWGTGRSGMGGCRNWAQMVASAQEDMASCR